MTRTLALIAFTVCLVGCQSPEQAKIAQAIADSVRAAALDSARYANSPKPSPAETARTRVARTLDRAARAADSYADALAHAAFAGEAFMNSPGIGNDDLLSMWTRAHQTAINTGLTYADAAEAAYNAGKVYTRTGQAYADATEASAATLYDPAAAKAHAESLEKLEAYADAIERSNRVVDLQTAMLRRFTSIAQAGSYNAAMRAYLDILRRHADARRAEARAARAFLEP